jgi:S1-C subfamily serine protease
MGTIKNKRIKFVSKGQVIGINVAIIEMSQNVGFAIPSTHFKMIEENLYNRPEHEKVLHAPILGIEWSNGSS